ncbi:hypothetical protein [Actinoplanes sp. NPDC020271]|uniref:hypothetical protein n=1 Tax=Actinoplanes sp. NPDC020271 TaxID=3363896 RepID=UPI0037BC769F
MLIGLLLLVSSAFLTLPALLGVKALLVAPSLFSLSSLFASFVLLVSSASIAIFLQLAVLSLTRWRAQRPVSPRSRRSVSSIASVPGVSSPAPVVPASVRSTAAALSSTTVLSGAPPSAAPSVSPVSARPVVSGSPVPARPVVSGSPVSARPVVSGSPVSARPVVSGSPVPARPVVSGSAAVPDGGAGRRSLRLVPFLLAALALLPGCTQAPAAQAATPAACGSATPDQVVANTALADGKAAPAPHRVSVPLGSQVRLGVSADTAAQIHVHGYDLEYQVQPGQPMCVVFVASRAGLFDVEAHPDTLLLQLEVK